MPSKIVLAAAYYFFYYGAVGCYIPYLNLYFEHTGLTGTPIGLLGAIAPLILLFAGPLWGAFGDRFRVHRYLLPLATFGPIVPTLLMPLTAQFVWLATLVALASFFAAPIASLIDSAVLELTENTAHSYGTVRLWGSVGYSLTSWIMGYVIEAFGLNWLFYGYAALLLLSIACAVQLPARRSTWQTSFGSSLRQLLAQPALVLFLGMAFLVGMNLSATVTFFPLHLQVLGGGAVLIGIGNALGAVSELPVMFYSQQIFRRLSVRGSLILACLIFALRWELMALTTSPYIFAVANLLHGLTYGLFIVSGVAYVNEHTPSGLSATAQSLFIATTFGIGSAVGASVGGGVYEAFGGSGLYHAVALTAMMSVLFLLPSVTASTQTTPK